MNTDHLTPDETKSSKSAISEIISFFSTPEFFLSFAVLVICIVSIMALHSYVEQCDGRVVRGILGLECIEVSK